VTNFVLISFVFLVGGDRYLLLFPFSAIVGLIILVVGAFLIWGGYRDYKDLKRDKLDEWK